MRTVQDVRATPSLESGRIDLTWRNPPASDFGGPENFVKVQVVRRSRTFPRDANDGTTIYDGPIVTQVRDEGLPPLTTYYYTVYAVDDAATPHRYADDGSQASAFSAADYDLTERLYRLLPGVHQIRDVLGPAELAALPPATIAALDALPPPLRRQGPLRRFFHAAAAPLDLMRSTAEQLPELHDPDQTPPRYLAALAGWLDWPLDRTLELHRQRNEVKAAPFLHREAGAPPSVRGLVTRYAGWETRIAELHQHLARAGFPPQLNIFAIRRDAVGWRGVEDAAALLGFGPGNDTAAGAPAVLPGSVAPYPFPLREGMELTVSADGRPPVTVRFGPGDFASIGAATAREVAAVINAAMSEVTARSFPPSPLDPPPLTENRIELRSHLTDSTSSIVVERSEASHVSLEGSPRGRLAACLDRSAGTPGRLRLAYETSDPMEPATSHLAELALRGIPFPRGPIPGLQGADSETGASGRATSVSVAARPLGQVRYKTFRAGTWGASLPVPVSAGAASGDPAIVELPTATGQGSLFMAWIEEPHTGASRIRFAIGRGRLPTVARLRGRRGAPFVVEARTHLVLLGPWPLPVGVEFTSSDVGAFVNPRAATAAEVAAILSARLPGVSVSVEPTDQTLVIQTTAAGGDQRLSIDLERSTAALALGFEAVNADAVGDWGDEIDWSASQDVTPAVVGRNADLAAVVDGAGEVVLFWSTHTGGRWEIVASRWNGVAWAPGAAVRIAPEVQADTASAHREPCAVRDAAGRLWLVWARNEPGMTSDDRMLDSWTLRRRVLPAGAPLTTWGPEAAVTTVPAGPGLQRITDREPGLIVEAGPPEVVRVYFRSDRAGGPDLWQAAINTTTLAIAPAGQVTDGAQIDGWPAPVAMPHGESWLLLRSDRSVPLARVGIRPLPPSDHRVIRRPTGPRWIGRSRSVRAPDTGTIHRYAGTTTPLLRDAARIARSRRWDDLLAYTPDKPLGEYLPRDDPRYVDQVLRTVDLYTRGTIQLFISEVVPASSIAVNVVERLRAALTRYLPINVRLVVDLAPQPFEEDVYTASADLIEEYLDVFPFLDIYDGLDETVGATVPTWEFLRSTLAGHVSGDPADTTTLRRRTFFPPPT